jgi:hypothetical protein
MTSKAVDATYVAIRSETNEIVKAQFYEEGSLPVTVNIPPDRAKAELRFLWENFWAAPFIARAGLFEYLMFPEHSIKAKSYTEAFDFVNDHLFSPGEPYSAEAREFIKAYFQVTPDYQHRILLSAMMVTSKRCNEENLGVGERLAAVLELLGPAETKLGQVIHSHPDTPSEIKEGMGKLKGDAAPPYRWDLLDNYRTCIPPEVRKNVSRIGKLLGSASFFLAFEATLKIGRKKTRGVFKILRPHALPRAEGGFGIMLKMLKILELDQNVIDVLEQMIVQARNNAQIETDHDINTQQTQIALQLYDRRTITINGEPFFLKVPRVLQHGSDPELGYYQFIELAPGKHFNDLPDKSLKQQEYKTKLAIAYFAFEINNLLQGNRFDSDRHGAQLRIKDNDLYLFDWGNMQLLPPAADQLEQLGSAIIDTLLSIMQGNPVSEGLGGVLDARAEQGEDIEFLLEVQKALLSLEDFRIFISQEQLIAILAASFQNNPHPAILQAMIARGAELGLGLEMLQEFMGGAPSSLQIDISTPPTSQHRRRRHNPYRSIPQNHISRNSRIRRWHGL